MSHSARQLAIAATATMLLAAVTLTGCEETDADDTSPLTQTSVDTSPVANTDAVRENTTSKPSPTDTTSEVASNEAPAAAQPTEANSRKPSASPVDVTFDDIKLDLEKDEQFVATKRTERLDELDGERIRIRGFILPGYQQSGLKQFVLVRDNMQCCFGPGAALFDCIVVEMVGDNSTDFSVRPVAVEGVFKVQELKDIDGRQLAIYHLDGEDVR